jgi:hypothetical protein
MDHEQGQCHAAARPMNFRIPRVDPGTQGIPDMGYLYYYGTFRKKGCPQDLSCKQNRTPLYSATEPGMDQQSTDIQ